MDDNHSLRFLYTSGRPKSRSVVFLSVVSIVLFRRKTVVVLVMKPGKEFFPLYFEGN